MKKIFIILVVSLLFSCTENQRTKMFGGNLNIDLPKSEKFINITFKNNDIWVLTQDTNKVYHFREYSDYGVFQGEITIK